MKSQNTILRMEEEVVQPNDLKPPKEKKPRKRCVHNRIKYRCKDCKGKGICEHNREKRKCKECKGSSICEHDKYKSRCIECKGRGICVHNRVKSICKECKGGSICEHSRVRSACIECKGGSICEHSRARSSCKDCKQLRAQALQRLLTPGPVGEPGPIRREIEDIMPQPPKEPGWMERLPIFDPPADET